MLVSALLTSVGINTVLCILFFMAYSVLKKQPSNFEVFRPRLLKEGKLIRRGKLARLIPTPGWVRKAWNLTEEDILLLSGLDGVVFMRLITFCLRIFTFAAVVGILFTLPVNCYGNQLHNFDFADISNNSLDLFTISNVNDGSERLWVHFCAVYIVTIFICYMLHNEYKYISEKRISYFHSHKPQPHQFTILIRSIPVPERTSISDSIESFFKEYHPSTYLSHIVIRRKNKLQNLMFEAKQLCKKVTQLQSDSHRQKNRQNDGIRLLGHRADLVDRDEKRLKNIELQQAEVSLREVQAAFVSFKSRYGAAVAFHVQQSENPTRWVTEEAPEPNDVYWPLFSSSFMGRWISKLLVIVACTLLTILFLIPVVFVQGLTNLNQLETWFPALKSILSRKVVSQVITGYLPNLILLSFLVTVPPTMKFLSSIQGYISNSDIERSACDKVIWFTVWNVFFATVFSGSFLYQISIILQPTHILPRLAISVPAQASFFVAYVLTSGWTSISSELFRVFPFICSLLKRVVGRKSENIAVPPFRFHRDIPRICFFALLGITYFFLAPLILPFLLVYFSIGYIIYRNQFLNVYAPKYETGGKFWPLIHNSMIFSLVLMHGIAMGIFTLKKLPSASSWMLPLPVFTLLFNEYCRKRFLPVFIAYSAESLIKKDREDQRNGNMRGFFDILATAYRDPALIPNGYAAHNDSHSNSLRRPLLS